MSSSVSFSFNPALIPADLQPAFMARFFQLVTEYQIVSSATTTPSPVAPSADTLPHPSEFVPVDGDDTSVPVAKPRKNGWAFLTDEQRAERLAAMKRGRENKAAERKMSTDSLVAPVPVVQEPVVDAVTDSGSETSSKKARKPRAPLTDEQRAARRAKLHATLAAKKAAATDASV